MKFILGKKQGMTQVFREDGIVIPVTRIQAGPCVVTQVKTKEKDGVNAVQFGFGKQKNFRLSKALQGHLKDVAWNEKESPRNLQEIKVEKHNLKKGDIFTVKIFTPGEKVQVTGTSKGKGFQGVVKRHRFKGSLATHGHKDQLRMPGSIGAIDNQRVLKGTRMGGHMGDEQVTIKNLEIIEVLPETNDILIKGAVPGAKNSLILISCNDGEIIVENENNEEVKKESVSEVKNIEESVDVVEEKEEKSETNLVTEDKQN